MIEEFDIKQLIPQRHPIMMVDELAWADDESAKCKLTIREDNYFLREDDCLNEVGIIEHMAQSASAHAGFLSKKSGSENPPIGYIGEVKNFRLHELPRRGDVLTTTVQKMAEADKVTIVKAETYVEDKLMAETQLKISIKG